MKPLEPALERLVSRYTAHRGVGQGVAACVAAAGPLHRFHVGEVQQVRHDLAKGGGGAVMSAWLEALFMWGGELAPGPSPRAGILYRIV